MRKIVSIVLVISLIVAAIPFSAFAQAPVSKEVDSANSVEKSTEVKGGMNGNNAREYYHMKAESVDIAIPKTPTSNIRVGNDNEQFLFGLPNCKDLLNGVELDNGTVVFDSTKKEYSVVVRAINGYSEESDAWSALRVAVVINNSNAPSKYDFTFDFPLGYTLVKDYDYADSEYNCGAVFICDENNEIVSTIDPICANDAKGNKVESFYEVEGNTLVQRIIASEDSAFPIVLASTTHPTRYTTFSLKKSNVKTLRDSYAGTTFQNVSSYIINVALLATESIVGFCWTSIAFNYSLWQSTNYTLWSNIYNGFNGNSYVECEAKKVWNSLHKAYAPSKDLSVVRYY